MKYSKYILTILNAITVEKGDISNTITSKEKQINQEEKGTQILKEKTITINYM